MRAALVLLVLFVLALSACQQEPADPKAEIEAAIHDHLSKQSGLALDKMEMEVQQVDVRGDTAEAQVVFRIKQGEGDAIRAEASWSSFFSRPISPLARLRSAFRVSTWVMASRRS